jgi:hypothetical protein
MAIRKSAGSNPKKPKKTAAQGPLEKALKEQEKATKTAQRKASETMLPMPLGISPEAAPFYYRNPKHKYGTCWKCGAARSSAGGLPGGTEAYWCGPCGGYLVVRDNPSDPSTLAIIEPKETKRNQKKTRGRHVWTEVDTIDETIDFPLD